jgi:hypothetical protein
MPDETIKRNIGNPINLSELIEAFDMQSTHISFYVNQKSGKIIFLTEDEITTVENEDEESDESNYTKEILDSEDFIEIPSQYELNKYEIMTDFIISLEDNKAKEFLVKTIKGKGAFRRFHATIQAHKIENQWYQFLKSRLRELAIEWCNFNGLVYTEVNPAND